MRRGVLAVVAACVVAARCANSGAADEMTLGFTLEPTSLNVSGTAGQSIP